MPLRQTLIWSLGWVLGLGALPALAQVGERSLNLPIAQTPAAPAASGDTAAPIRGNTFYDRYMLAGYAATNRRDHATALVYFQRALDERPGDSYATQAIRNVQGYLGTTPSAPAPVTVKVPTGPAPVTSPPATATKPTPPKPTPAISKPAKPTTAKPATKPAPKPAPTKPSPTKPTATQPPAANPSAKTSATPTPPTKLTPPKTPPPASNPAATTKAPTAVVVVPAAPTSDAFNESQAIALINRWLQAKTDVFAPPYDQQPIADLTTGELLASLVRPNGVLNWLKTNRAYFRYGVQKVDGVERFVVARDRATMEINLTEDRTLYLDGVIDPSRTDFSSQRVRFTFALDNGIWKIADYKTVQGALLERSVLTPTNSAVR